MGLDPRFKELTDLVARQTEVAPQGARTLAHVEERLREGRWTRRPGRSGRWLITGGALACALVVAFYFGRTAAQDAPLGVALEAKPEEVVGHWIAAESETKQLQFSDGTEVALSPKTSVFVRETTSRGGTVELGAGRALARIVPLEGARWNFLAGPFSVRVTGTAFELAWDPGTETLELALHHGSVELKGPTVDGPRRVSQGQFVRIELGRARSASPGGSERQALGGGTNPAVAAESGADNVLNLDDDEPQTAPERKASRENELWQMAQKARIGGDAKVARDSLLRLRASYNRRGNTAFLLGKIYADQLGDTKEAVRWFRTYLNEVPQGSLNEQAMGRLLELLGAGPARADIARRYLVRYPSGSFASLARRSLE